MATKLPTIDNKGPGNNQGDKKSMQDSQENFEYISPFRLPSDDEVFVYREAERQKKNELKALAHDLKIWEKKTGASKQPLRLFKNTELPPVKENKPVRTGFSNKDKALILEAQKIINERRKNKETGLVQKETIIDLLEQKKEMFLVEMTVGIIENQKNELIKKEEDKREALKKSDEMLSKDNKDFETYMQNNEQEKKQATLRYEKEVNERKAKESEFKKKKNEETSLKTEAIKNEALIEEYKHQKEFLDSLAPREFIENRDRRIKEFVEDFKYQWIERELAAHEDQQSNYTESNKGVGTRTGDRRSQANKAKLKALDETFKHKLEREEFDEIEEFKLKQEMFFKEPHQLEEIFSNLEAKNLEIIEDIQREEESLDTLRNIFFKLKREMDEEIARLKENKMQLEKKKAEKEDRIRTLEFKIKDNQSNKKKERLLPLRKHIIEVFENLREGKDGVSVTGDLDSKKEIELLAAIENLLEKQLKDIKTYDKKVVQAKKRECDENRKKENFINQRKKEEELTLEKARLAEEKLKEASKKRKGRIDMAKSAPLVKEEKVEETNDHDEEEEQNRYFRKLFNDY